jgi:hypothetical protein
MDQETYESENSNWDTTNSIINYHELSLNGGYNPDYCETLIAKQDTLFIGEDLDNRFNNKLIEILPNEKGLNFKLSACYLTSLYEVFDYRNYSNEEIDSLYQSSQNFKDNTQYIPLQDSAQYFFRAFPHTSDLEEVTIKDGKVVTVEEQNTEKQKLSELMYFENELNQIKRKYGLKDTLVIIPMEYDIVATLTKNQQLYNYIYESFLVKIEVFRKKEKIETKYIQIYIMYGC